MNIFYFMCSGEEAEPTGIGHSSSAEKATRGGEGRNFSVARDVG